MVCSVVSVTERLQVTSALALLAVSVMGTAPVGSPLTDKVLADVPYENRDQEYLDAVALDRILKKAGMVESAAQQIDRGITRRHKLLYCIVVGVCDDDVAAAVQRHALGAGE